jgi:hypothetical protein
MYIFTLLHVWFCWQCADQLYLSTLIHTTMVPATVEFLFFATSIMACTYTSIVILVEWSLQKQENTWQAVIDHTAYPHIIDQILQHSDNKTRMVFRGTSKHYLERIYGSYGQHLQIRPAKQYLSQLLDSLLGLQHQPTPICIRLTGTSTFPPSDSPWTITSPMETAQVVDVHLDKGRPEDLPQIPARPDIQTRRLFGTNTDTLGLIDADSLVLFPANQSTLKPNLNVWNSKDVFLNLPKVHIDLLEFRRLASVATRMSSRRHWRRLTVYVHSLD